MVKLLNKMLKPLGLWVHLILEGKRFGGWTYPRFWLHRFKRGATLLHIEFDTWSRFCSLSVGTGHDQELSFHIAFPPFSLWFSFTIPDRFEEAIRRLSGVEGWDLVDIFGVHVHHGALWWDFMASHMVSSSSTPWWREGSFDPVDFLFGRGKSELETLSVHKVEIPMPEGVYHWKIEMQRRTMWRPRWPFKRDGLEYSARPLDGEAIPFPGKGTMSYNCGPDALCGQSGPEATVEMAISKIVHSVLDSRKRYGGTHRYVIGGKYDPDRVVVVPDPEPSGDPPPVAQA
jgi:hypothetical protein